MDAGGSTLAASPLVRLIASRPTRHGVQVRIALLVAFVALTTIGLIEHSMWLDEMLAWNLARDTDSLGDLTSLLHYGGHPIGWYLPLFAITRVTGDPAWLQVLQGLIATGTFAMILFRTPFRLSVQVLLAASYFFAFEYAVISRPYALCALLFLVAVDALARERPRRILATVVLVALVFVHQLGAVLAIALVLLEIWRALRRRAAGARPVPRDALVSAGVVLVAVAVMLVSVAPASDAGRRSFLAGGRLADAPLERIGTGISGIARGLLPIPHRFAWDDLVWPTVSLEVAVLVSVVLWAAVLLALRRNPSGALLWIVGSVGLVAFFILAYPPRHVRFPGFFVLLLVAACWYSVRDTPAPEDGSEVPTRPNAADRVGIGVVGVLLVTQVVIAALLTVHFLRVPFTDARERADAIRAAGLDERVVSAFDYHAIPVAGYLDHDFRSLAIDEDTRVVVFRQGTTRAISEIFYDQPRAFREAAEIAACDGEPVALLLGAEASSPPDGTRFIAPGVYEVEPGPRPASCPT